MLNRNTLDELTHKITALLPENMKQMQHDLESNVHALLQNALSKMHLVTREEFDVQAALLARTREKLDRLERELQALESKK
jgi:BMFP domain-containing protein YqiC